MRWHPRLLMASLGIRLGLGTDGTRSDGFRLMDAAETAQRLAFGLASGDSSAGGGWTWLAMAMRRQRRRRRAEAASPAASPPAWPPTSCWSTSTCPSSTPSWDLGWELVRLADRSQIEAVVVQGRLRLWRGWPVDWDAQALMRDADRIARAAVASAPIRRVHAVSSAHRQAVSDRPAA